MKNRLLRIAASVLSVVMIITVLPLSLLSIAESPVNIVANPGFESPGSDWTLASHAKVPTLWKYDDTEKHSGNYSLKAVSAEQSEVTYDLSLSQYAEIDSSKQYLLSVWIKTSDATKPAAIKIRECKTQSNSGASWLTMDGSTHLIRVDGTNDWAEYTFMISGLKSTTKYARLYCEFGMNGSGAAWFDDVSLTEYTPPVTTDFHASVPEGKVNGNTVVKLIPKDENSIILFTLDGSDPITSPTRMRYSDEYGIIITEDLTITAVELKENQTTGEVKVFKYTCAPLVNNGDFEKTSGWSVSPSKSWEYDNEIPHGGKACMKGTGGDAARYIMSDFVNVSPAGYEYKISFWYRTEAVKDDAFSINILQSDGTNASWYGGEAKGFFVSGGTNEWTEYTGTLSGLSEKTIRFRLYARLDADSGGEAWVDDFRVTAVQNAIPGDQDGSIISNVAEGRVKSNTIVKLKASHKKADIYYTIDGSDPVTSKTRMLYSELDGIIITQDTEIKAFPFIDGGEPGELQTFSYKCDPMLPDGGFAEGVGKWIVDEEIQGWKEDKSVYHSAPASARGESKYSTDVILYTTRIPVNSKYRYELSFWLKTDSVGDADGFSLNIIQSADGATKGWYNAQIKGQIVSGGTQDWTKYTYVLDGFYDDTVDSIRVYARLSAGTGGRAWVDDFSLNAIQNEFYPVEQLEGNSSTYQGNIYTDSLNTAVKYTLRLANNSKSKQKVTITTESFFADTGEPLSSNSSEVTLGAGAKSSYSPSVGEIRFYGNFRLDITISDSDGMYSYKKSYYLSRVLSTSTASLTDKQRDESGYASAVHLGQWGFEDKKIVDQAVLAGNSWIRDGMRWYNVECNTKGVYDFPDYWDKYFSYAKEKGLKINLAVTGGNAQFYGSLSNAYMPETDEQIEGFSKFVAAAAEKYKDYISAIELFNEYNAKNFNPSNATPETYVKTAKRVYELVKAVAPDIKIVCGATSGVDIPWLTKFFEAGGYDYCDVISVHPYVENNAPEKSFLKAVTSLKALMQQYGEPKPLWATEFGYTTYINPASVFSPGYNKMTSSMDKKDKSTNETVAAEYAARVYTMMQSGIFDKVFWYCLINKSAGVYNGACLAPYSEETNYGLSHGFGDKQSPLAAKSALISINAVHSLLLDTTFVGEEKYNDSLSAYRFRRNSDGKSITVLWLTGQAIEGRYLLAEVASSEGEAVTYDFYGNATAVIGTEKQRLEIGSAPTYIEGEFSLDAVGIYVNGEEIPDRNENENKQPEKAPENTATQKPQDEYDYYIIEGEDGTEDTVRQVVTQIKKKKPGSTGGKNAASDGISPMLIAVLIAGGALLIGSGTFLMVLLFKKRKGRTAK